MHACFLCAAPNAFVFISNVTGEQYTLNTTWVSQVDAEKQCACTGGHLVSYTSLDEQQEVGSRLGMVLGAGMMHV